MSQALSQQAGIEPVRFGDRYWLLRQLAVGGMAEIYLARQNARAGFEKDVVIKRLKPELAGDPRIVEMFLDEARIGAVLNHPNIVHVYDVEEHEGIPYIAMEYIVGEELNQLCRRGLALGKFLPLEHAIELMRQAAAGMGYFHHRRAADHHLRAEGTGAGGGGGTNTGDNDLDIVHLDISPTNLLVTEDGFLKIIDFGIAKARGQRFRDEGAIPGKLSYMSPEQAGRQRVDHRSDIFSLGIVLYEITVGKRLFKGPAAEVVKKLVDGVIEPPTFVRRDFPGPLEAIVMRCLERHPADRYQSAYDLADDLEDILRELKLHSGPVRIARYLDELSGAAGGQRRPELISESELDKGDDDLDFDSKVFDAYQAAEGLPQAVSDWDEFEESDAGVAEALGIDLEQLRQMRTPVPEYPAKSDDDQHGGGGGVSGGGGLLGGGGGNAMPRVLESERLPLRAPARTPLPFGMPSDASAPAMIVSRPPQPTPAPSPVVPRPSPTASLVLGDPSVVQGPPKDYTPYLVFGGLGAAVVTLLLYFLL